MRLGYCPTMNKTYEIEPLPRESTNPVKGSNENEENQRNNIDIELSSSTPIKGLELTLQEW